MRNYVIILLMLCITIDIVAQDLKESEVPKEVVAALKAKYPDVFVHEWEWEKKKGVYEAEFMMDGSEHEAYFKPDGTWILTEREIKVQDLPSAVFSSFKDSEYANWKIDDIEEHQTPDHDLLYEIEVEKKEIERSIYTTYPMES